MSDQEFIDELERCYAEHVNRKLAFAEWGYKHVGTFGTHDIIVTSMRSDKGFSQFTEEQIKNAVAYIEKYKNWGKP